jgi:LCP family protein required for cell wall assembly
MSSSGAAGPGRNPAGAGVGPSDKATVSSSFDESGLRTLGDQVNRSSGSRRRLRPGRPRTRTVGHRRLWWTLGAVGTVLVLIVGGTAGYAWYVNHQIHRYDVHGLVDIPTTGADAGTQNILLVGSTDRCALKVQNAAYGLCSQGVTGVNSDVVMILHLNPATRAVSILSIPRDLFVPNARTTGANKIDAALYEGPSQLVAAINQNLGIPVQHYVVLNFDTFANVVDALGGVKMYFREPVFDAYSGLKVLTPGCVNLDGLHALQVVRARHLQYKPPGVTTADPAYWPFENQSDLARIRRNHEFLRVLATAVSRTGLSDPITDARLISSVAPQLSVDKSFSSSDMVHMVLDFHGVSANNAPQLTLPVQIDQFGSYRYKGASYGDIEFPSNVEDNQVIHQFLGIGPTIDTMTQRQWSGQPGHRHRRRPQGTRLHDRGARGLPSGWSTGRDGGLLRPQEGGGPGRRPGRGQVAFRCRHHRLRPHGGRCPGDGGDRHPVHGEPPVDGRHARHTGERPHRGAVLAIDVHGRSRPWRIPAPDRGCISTPTLGPPGLSRLTRPRNSSSMTDSVDVFGSGLSTPTMI